jgi:imidazole glycerol phosphate synthase subunit HisF
VIEVEGSHVIMVSQPEAVANVIKTAAAAVEAGADKVSLNTAALADPRLPERIIRELERDHG